MYSKFEECEQWENLHNDLPLYYDVNVHTDTVSKNIKEDHEAKDLNNQQLTKNAKSIKSHCKSSKRKKSSKHRSVYLRRDVVNKGIFRGLNRFYNKLFKFKTSYKCKSRDTLYSQFSSHVIHVLRSYQVNLDLSNVVDTNGRLDKRLSNMMHFLRFINTNQVN